MSLFRDQDGNLYDIPETELQRFRVEGEVAEGSALGGAELPGEPAPPADRPAPGLSYLYCYWYEGTRPGDKRTAVAPDVGRAQGGPAYLYCYWYEDTQPPKRTTAAPAAPAVERSQGELAYLYCYWYEDSKPPKR